jgi:photosystem II stability/assembly factor-like uncharacterized protein
MQARQAASSSLLMPLARSCREEEAGMGNLRNSVGRGFGLALAIPVVTAGILLNTSWGATWTEINAGLPGTGLGVNALTIDPNSPSIIYAQTFSNSLVASSGLFKTTNGGGSWGAVSSVVGATVLVIDPKNPSTLYAGTDQGVVKTTNGGVSWADASSGLANGSVRTLIIDPITPATLYAVTISAGLGLIPISLPGPLGPVNAIFKSTNGAGSWKALDTGLPPNAFINVLTIDPKSPSTIYFVSPPTFGPVGPGGPPSAALLKSTDGGESWKALNLPPNTFISSLAIDPITSSTIYAVTNMGILKSTDGGISWNALNPGPPANANISTLVFDPKAPSTIYAAASSFTPPGPPSWGILKSTDGGENWIAFNLGLPRNTTISSLALDPITPSRIYAGVLGIPFPLALGGGPAGAASGGVVKSADGGESWNDASAGLVTFDVRTVAMSPVDSSTIYAGGLGGVFKSTDGGTNWNGTGLSAYTGSLLAGLANANILYAQTGRSFGCNSDEHLLLKSADGAASWNDASPLNSGCILNVAFFSAHVAPMVIDLTDPNTLYLGESDDQDGYSAVLKSTDGGANWTAAWDWFTGLQLSVMALAIDPAHPATLYAGIDDGSATPFVVPSAPGSSGLFKSTDGGASWSNTGFTNSAVNLLAINPSNSKIIYAGTEEHYSVPKGFQGLFKSTDGGISWVAINNGLAGVIETHLTSTTALIFDPANSNILYLGTSNGGVFRSVDGGADWSPFNDGLTNLQIRALAVAPGTTHTVYAGTSGGVFKIFGE